MRRFLRHRFVVVDWTGRGRVYKDWQLSIIVARSNFAVCQRYTFERAEWEEVIAASRAKKVFSLSLSPCLLLPSSPFVLMSI